MFRGLRSIRGRMTVAYALSIALVMVTVCASASWYSRALAERQADSLLRGTAAQIRADQLSGDPAEHLDELREGAAGLRARNLAVTVVGTSGDVLFASERDAPVWPRRSDGYRVAVARAGRSTIVVGMPWGPTEAALRHQSGVLVVISIVVVLSSGLGAWVLVGRSLRPIDSLARQALSASIENLTIRLHAPSQDEEVLNLVGTLNDLLGRVGDLAAGRSRFYMAATHELRTPLQALSGHLEVALSRQRSGTEYRAAIEEGLAQTRRLTALVQDLLLLGRLESRPRTSLEAVDVADVCERAVEQYLRIATERGVTFDARLDIEAQVLAPATHVDILVRNLVENAARYSKPGSLASIVLSPGSAGVGLVVCNECELLGEEAFRNLGEPFYRPDASRSANTGGSGLGLAICRAIAAANSWGFSIERHSSGVYAKVEFAAATDAAPSPSRAQDGAVG